MTCVKSSSEGHQSFVVSQEIRPFQFDVSDKLSVKRLSVGGDMQVVVKGGRGDLTVIAYSEMFDSLIRIIFAIKMISHVFKGNIFFIGDAEL